MLKLNKNDVKILRENFDDNLINRLDPNNVNEIYQYLESEGIYYTKDIFLYYMNLFLYPLEEFIEKFKKFKMNNGDNYIENLADNLSLLSEIE